MKADGFVSVCMALLPVVASSIGVSPLTVLKGTGADDSQWKSEPFKLEPAVPYVLSCKVRHPDGNDVGVAIANVAGTPMYWHPKGRDWRDFAEAFSVGQGGKPVSCTLRQWHVPGTVEFKDVRISRARTRYRRVGTLELGFGEQMDGNVYRFGTRLLDATHLQARPLVGYRGLTYNNGVLTFNKGADLTYAHELSGRRLISAEVSVAYESDKRGAVNVFASRDGKSWSEVGVVSNTGVHRLALPAALFPAERIQVSVRNTGKAPSGRVFQYAFDAVVDGPAAFGFGATDYLDAETGAKLMAAAPWSYLDDVTSGEVVPGGERSVTLWRQSSGRKVFRGRPVPTAKATALRVSAARNETEAVQLVVRPAEALRAVRVEAEVSDDVEVEVRRVGYVLVDLLRDEMGARGLWPDPLFEQATGCDVAANENQPFWLTVKPKKGARAGLRKGTVTVRAERCGKAVSWTVPLEVRVFGFDFPDKVTCQTAFGVKYRNAHEYHHVTSGEDRAAVTTKYLEHFARHHVSPYKPTPNAPAGAWTDVWPKAGKPAEAEPVFRWEEWDAAMEKALDEYHFNTFSLSVKGKGSMDPASRKKPAPRRINGAKEGDPRYEAYMEKYLRAVESHLREKGWLNAAYVYSFDEPRREDYPYMLEDLRRFRRYAPGLRRMVTFEPTDDEDCRALEGAVSLWCLLTEHYDRAFAQARQKAGDQVWWYLTYATRAPKVNEHIEHSGVDFRVWLWQTWKEGVTGILVWETLFWNNPRAYPDPKRPQNPYEDTMCWGGRGPWNTGEGKLLYPPPKCFAQGGPVIAGPTDSIRFEMLREGLEDYEYFVLLKKLDPSNALLSVPTDVAISLDDYSTDPAGMECHRLRLAEAIERKSGRF